jgi:hypothetical protein
MAIPDYDEATKQQFRYDILRVLDNLSATDSTTPAFNMLMEELCACYERAAVHQSVLDLGISEDSLFQVIHTFTRNFTCAVSLHIHMQNPLYKRVSIMNYDLLADCDWL